MSTSRPAEAPGTIPTIGYLRLKQVLQIIPVSSSAWWEGCKNGRFPKPIKLSPRTTVWKVEDIRAFMESLNTQNA